jgi:phthiocerol/phenolphthiocerol synthesis type-I polyketide synthase C
MNRSNIIKIVRDEVSDILAVPSDQIESSTDFFSLGLDSVMVVQLVLRLRRDFDVTIHVKDFFISPCIDGIVDMVESRLTKSNE